MVSSGVFEQIQKTVFEFVEQAEAVEFLFQFVSPRAVGAGRGEQLLDAFPVRSRGF